MRIFSGIQPTGKIHLGNYIGAISQWVKLQKKGECFIMIADLHSLTIPYNPKDLQKNILDTFSSLLSLGIDPKKTVIFLQSEIKEHTFLCWILNTICKLGEISRMTQFKEKAKYFKENVNVGLLDYPVLQVADILLYDADIVPVGKDQLQHIELARDLAKRFNKKFGETFKIPKPLILKGKEKIMSLSDPLKKMSKSIPSSCLFLDDSFKIVEEKIMRAKTDLEKEIRYDKEKKPGISNLMVIYSFFSKKNFYQIEKDFKGKGYEEFKKEIIKEILKFLKPYQKKKKELLKEKSFLKKILKEGTEKAQKIASSKIKKVKEKIGISF